MSNYIDGSRVRKMLVYQIKIEVGNAPLTHYSYRIATDHHIMKSIVGRQ